MKIRRYTSNDIVSWNTFIENSKNSLFMFNRNYMEYHSDRFIDNSLIFYNENNEIMAVLPLNRIGNELFSHSGLTFGGVIVDSRMKQHHMSDLFDCLLCYMRENAFNKLLYKQIPHIYHKQPAEEDLYSLFCHNAKLEKVEAATVMNLKNVLKMPKGRKAQVLRAKREGVTVEESEDFNAFINLENEVLSKYHDTKAVHTGRELSLLHERFPGNIKLYVGTYCGSIIAGCVLFVYDNVVHTQYLAANDQARKIGALDLVIYHLIEMYSSSKIWFDFGKSTEGDGLILNNGLISQKEGFGGRTCVYNTWSLSV